MRDRAEDHKSRHRFIAPLLAALAMLAVFGPGLARYAERASDPMVFADDVAQHIAPYLPPLHAEPADYIHSYLRACHPIGFRSLYTLAASVTDPRPFSKVLAGVLFLAFLVLLAAAAYANGGWAAAAFVVATALSADIFLNRIASGLVRSFAFPLSAAFFCGVLHGRVRWLIGISVLAAAFYPTVAITGGLTLAALLLILPAHLRGDACAWSLRRRMATLAGAAGVMAMLVVPTMLSTRPYGPLLPKNAEAEYPEAGVGGRSREPVVSADYAENAALASFHQAGRAFSSSDHWFRLSKSARQRWTSLFIACGFLGLAFAALRRHPAALRLAAASLATVCAYGLSVHFSPHLYLPERYLLFAAPLVTLLGIPLGIHALLVRRTVFQTPALLAATIALLALVGGPVERRLGMNASTEDLAGLATAIAQLPPDACVAGWPTHCDFVPYLTERRVLVSYETHLAFHRAYLDAMRTRMDALISAYCATNIEPVLALRAHGATHLLVNTAHLDQPPSYFKPFDDHIAAARGNLARTDLALDRLLDQALWTDGENYLLDLALVKKSTR